ncbi:hypothetical protein [Tanticharoenia sakaeratensis]|jgi:hypothetical protein|uniref:hypothetical protein n=1 Tax=Tanticharoenia sakaeratensis TaxID=444053 RepID=UPI002231B8A5|nr:hypothetical protein [Tanticharoenia sakaeratensis]
MFFSLKWRFSASPEHFRGGFATYFTIFLKPEDRRLPLLAASEKLLTRLPNWLRSPRFVIWLARHQASAKTRPGHCENERSLMRR